MKCRNRITILVFIFVFVISCYSVSFAETFDYSQIVSFVDAIAIDGEKVFSEGTEYNIKNEWKNDSRVPYLVIDGQARLIDTDSVYDSSYAVYGAAFFWLTDLNTGYFLMNNDYPIPSFHQWKCEKAEFATVIMDILPSVYPEWHYYMGDNLAFIITTVANLNNPEAILCYNIDESYNPERIEAIFHNSKKYSESVKKAMEQYNLSLPIQKGDKGQMVTNIQEKLNELGYDVGKADGDYGNKTKTMIEAFQTDNNLEITGIVDEETFACLFPKVDTEEQTQSASSGIIPKPTTIDGIAPTPTPSQDSTDWAAIGEAMKDIDVNNDGYLSMDEIFN